MLSTYEELSDTQIERHSRRYWTSSSQVVKVMKRQDWGNCHRPEQTKETWQLKAFGIQDLILDQRKDIGEKLVKSKQIVWL